MRHLSQSLIVALALVLVINGCGPATSSTDTPKITVSGVVLKNSDDLPLNNVIVRQMQPVPEQYTVTNAEGAYSLEVPVDSLVSIRLSFILEGYTTREVTVTGVPGRDVTVPIQKLRAEGDSPDDPGNGGTPPPPSTSGTAASISVGTVSRTEIVVKETGGFQQSEITFVVTDSVGVPLDANNFTQVQFILGGSPGGGEVVNPATATTNASGTVKTTLTSGTVSGVAQVIAQITKPGGEVIRSRPVNVVIRSGLPSADHFSVAPAKLNYPGYDIFGLENSITAFVGDRYSNFVSPGTAVYFTTDGGLIEGAALTNEEGRATTTLMSALPRPNHVTLGSGFALVRARTVSNDNVTIETSTIVLLSGTPSISINPSVVNVPHGGSQSFQFTVSDQNGNPLAAETNIRVKVEGENMRVIGDVDLTLLDTQARGQGTTEFQFTITDDDDEVEKTEPVQVTITTEGPNGKATLTITGITRKAIPD